MTLHWNYVKTNPNYSQGQDTVRKNFSREERTPAAIFMREVLQNALDARLREDAPVHVSIRILGPGMFDSDYLKSIFTTEFNKRLNSANSHELESANNSSIIVIEDFGTRGLIGEYTDTNKDGREENWNAFWHREGEGAKGHASNGGAGQGKISYYALSKAATVLGFTVRATDKLQLLMGRAAFLRDYRFEDGEKYVRNFFWTTQDNMPMPETNDVEIQRFSRAFNIKRDSATSGLSVVIPFARQFQEREALIASILDFYIPIKLGHLIVEVGQIQINSSNIDNAAEDHNITDDVCSDFKSCFSKAFRSFVSQIIANPSEMIQLDPVWNESLDIPESAFPADSLSKAREVLSQGGRLSFKLPVCLNLKNGITKDSYFHVYLEISEQLRKSEGAFIRRDLVIGSEKPCDRALSMQRVRCLIWIKERNLSDFLLSAEEPTHLKWNESFLRDNAEYETPIPAFRSIRNVVRRLLAVLINNQGRKDSTALARFFPQPASGGGRRGAGQKGKKQLPPEPPPPEPPPPEPPPPEPKPFRFGSNGSSIYIVANSAMPLEKSQLPVHAHLTLAYEGLDGNAFDAWDPFDFDLSKSSEYPLKSHGIKIISADKNRIEIEIIDHFFGLQIDGFDPNLRLKAQFHYRLNEEFQRDHAESLDG